MEEIRLLAQTLSQAAHKGDDGSLNAEISTLQVEESEKILERIEKTDNWKTSSAASTALTLNRQHLQLLKSILQAHNITKEGITAHEKYFKRIFLSPLKSHAQFFLQLDAQLNDRELFRNESYLRKAKEAVDLRLQELEQLSIDVKNVLASFNSPQLSSQLEEAWNAEWNNLAGSQATTVTSKIDAELKFYEKMYQRRDQTQTVDSHAHHVHPEDFIKLKIQESLSTQTCETNDSSPVKERLEEMFEILKTHLNLTSKSAREKNQESQTSESRMELLQEKKGNSIFAIIPEHVDYVVHGFDISQVDSMEKAWNVVDKLLLALKYIEVKFLCKTISSKQLRLYTTRVTHYLRELSSNVIVANDASLSRLLDLMSSTNQRLAKKGGQILFRQESITGLVDFEAAVPQIKKEVEQVVNRYVEVLGKNVSAETLFEERNALVLVAEKYCNRLSQMTKKNKSAVEKDSDDELIENPGDDTNYHTVHWKDLWILACEHTEEHHHILADELQYRTAVNSLSNFLSSLHIWLKMKQCTASSEQQFQEEIERLQGYIKDILGQLRVVDYLCLKVSQSSLENMKPSSKELNDLSDKLIMELSERIVHLTKALQLSQQADSFSTVSLTLESYVEKKFILESFLHQWKNQLKIKCPHYQTTISQLLQNINKQIQQGLQEPLKDMENEAANQSQSSLKELQRLNTQMIEFSTVTEVREALSLALQKELYLRLHSTSSSDLLEAKQILQSIQNKLLECLQTLSDVNNGEDFITFIDTIFHEYSQYSINTETSFNTTADVATFLKIVQTINAMTRLEITSKYCAKKTLEVFIQMEEKLRKDVEKFYCLEVFLKEVKQQMKEVEFELHIWNLERSLRLRIPFNKQATSLDELNMRLQRAISSSSQLQKTFSAVDTLRNQLLAQNAPKQILHQMDEVQNRFSVLQQQMTTFQSNIQQDIDHYNEEWLKLCGIVAYGNDVDKLTHQSIILSNQLDRYPEKVSLLQDLLSQMDELHKEYNERRNQARALSKMSLAVLESLQHDNNALMSSRESCTRLISQHLMSVKFGQQLRSHILTLQRDLEVCEKTLFDRAVNDSPDIESFYRQRVVILKQRIESAGKELTRYMEKQLFHHEPHQLLLRDCEAKCKVLQHLVQSATQSQQKRAANQKSLKALLIDFENDIVHLQMAGQAIRANQDEPTNSNLMMKVDAFFNKAAILNEKLFQQKVNLYDSAKASLQPDDINSLLKKLQQTVSQSKHTTRRRIQLHIENMLKSNVEEILVHWGLFCSYWIERFTTMFSDENRSSLDDDQAYIHCLTFLEMSTLWEQYLMYYMEYEKMPSNQALHSWSQLKDYIELINNIFEQRRQINLQQEMSWRNFLTAIEQMKRHSNLWKGSEGESISLQKLFTLYHMMEIVLKELRFQHEDYITSSSGGGGGGENNPQIDKNNVIKEWNEYCERMSSMCRQINDLVDVIRSHSVEFVKCEKYLETAREYLPRLRSRLVPLSDKRLIISMLRGKQESFNVNTPLPKEINSFDTSALISRTQILSATLEVSEFTLSRWEKSISSSLGEFNSWITESVKLRDELLSESTKLENSILLPKSNVDILETCEESMSELHDRLAMWIQNSRKMQHEMDKNITKNMRPMQRDVLQLLRYVETLHQKRKFMLDVVKECEKVWQSEEFSRLKELLPVHLA